MPVKGNQATLQANIERCLRRTDKAVGAATKGLGKQPVRAVGDEAGWPPLRYAATNEVGHGRIERRQLEVRNVPTDLAWLDWPGCQQVFALHRESRCKKSGRYRQESVYGITSLSEQEADAASLLAMVRAHWQIENGVHWVRDVTYDEV